MASHDGASSSSSSGSSFTHDLFLSFRALDTGNSFSSVSSFAYDVFLSFRGPDTGNSFTAFLHKHLVKEGVDVYIDREDLRAGEEIKSALFKAIQRSKISIPVFSKGYADSRWCLDELVEIVRCHRDNGQIILPIFFDVDPKDVRHQTGSFKTSFDKHKDKDRFDEQSINSWKEALKEVAAISGYDLGQVTWEEKRWEKWEEKKAVYLFLEELEKYKSRQPTTTTLLGGLAKVLFIETYNSLGSPLQFCSSSSTKEKSTGLVFLGKNQEEDLLLNQSKLVDLVVERVLSESSGKGLDDVKNPVGLDARVKEVKDRLCIGSNDVQFVGIWGTGGIGKTTIAKILYNHIFKSFRRSCFLADIKGEEASDPKGLVHLQEQLIYSISRWKFDGNIGNVYRGRQLIIEKLQGENVLLILDDVASQSQLDAFAIESNWFGPASRIVITSRDKHILKLAKVDEDKIYCPEYLDDKQSLQLFSLHAFSSHQPPEEYLEFSRDLIHHAGGLPLTLVVWGSTFSDEEYREEEVWKSMLQELTSNPHDEVFKKLKISYDSLTDHEKFIFLDAACYFVGWKKEILISMWDACGFNPISAIKKLTQKSLLKFIPKPNQKRFTNDELWMHDQIQAMGRHIVNQKGHMERSRICSHEEILEAIEKPEGAQMLEVICVRDGSLQILPDRLDFAMMSKLRVLHIDGVPSEVDILHLPPDLRWFKCNTLIVPVNFYHKKLVYMDLSRSRIGEAWTERPQNENQRFQKLKVLRLRHWDVCDKSLDFSWFPYLETLDLRRCVNMVNLLNSIGDLKFIAELNLEWTKIKELPNSICNLSSLKVLNLSGCESLKNLPESIGELKFLVKLDLGNARLEALPNSICCLSSLRVLTLHWCLLKNLPESIGDLKFLGKFDLQGQDIEEFPSSICKLSSLISLDLSFCTSLKKLPDEVWPLEKLEELSIEECHNLVELPISWGRMSCLRTINLIGTRILLPRDDYVILPFLVELNIGNDLESSPPPWISGLPRLQNLQLAYTRLESLPDLPSTLTSLTLRKCYSLQTLPDLSSLSRLTSLRLRLCKELKEILGIERMVESLEELEVKGCKYLVDTQRWKIHGQGTLLVDEIPQGVNNFLVDEMSQGINIYSLNVNDDGINKRLILCVVFKLSPEEEEDIICDVQEGQLVDICLCLEVSICRRNHGRTNTLSHQLVIEGVEYTSERDMIYVHCFKGIDWFGIPLEPGTDAIVSGFVCSHPASASDIVLEIVCGIKCEVKFWKVWLESTVSEHQQQQEEEITSQEDESPITAARRMVADFFRWSCDDDHERSHHFASSSNALEIEGSNPIPQQAEQSSNDIRDSHNDLSNESPITAAMRMVADLFRWSRDDDHGRCLPLDLLFKCFGIEGSNPIPQQAEQSSNETRDSHNDLRFGSPTINSQCDLEVRSSPPNQGGGQVGRVAEDSNLSQQALGSSPERMWRVGKRPLLDLDEAGPSGAY